MHASNTVTLGVGEVLHNMRAAVLILALAGPEHSGVFASPPGREAFGRKQGEATELLDEPEAGAEDQHDMCRKPTCLVPNPKDYHEHVPFRLPTSNTACGFHPRKDFHYLPDPDFFKCARENPSKDWAADADKLWAANKETQLNVEVKPWTVLRMLEHGACYNLYTIAHTIGALLGSGAPVVVSPSLYR